MKMVLGVVRSGRAMDFGSKKWNRCLTRGLPMDNPQIGLGLLKIVRIACWTKVVHEKLLHVIAW